MHISAGISAQAVAEEHVTQPGLFVVDVGGMNLNGSMRPQFEAQGATYISVDMSPHPSVDVVCPPGQPLPFPTGSVDIVVTSSCFEHDPFFWMTFKECCRVLKPGGILYINAPQNGPYHGHPGDNWRFYGDAAAALAAWSSAPVYTNHDIKNAFWRATTLDDVKTSLDRGGNVYPVVVVEQFFAGPFHDVWVDCNMIFRRTTEVPDNPPILLDPRVFGGPVCTRVQQAGLPVFRHYNQ